MLEKGYIQVYTGNGKGKTTSSIGLVIRALGAGYKVFFSQFMKNSDYSEIIALKNIEKNCYSGQLVIEQFGLEGRLFQKPDSRDREAASEGFNKAFKAVSEGDFDLVILDEINIAVYKNIIDESEVLNLMENKSESTELILTGRYATDNIIGKADLVSEINPIKHYADEGISARMGIER